MSEGAKGHLPAVMDTRQAAQYLGVSYGRLRNLLWLGKGPKSFNYGKRDRRFRVSDLDAFIAVKVGEMGTVERRSGRARRGRTDIYGIISIAILAIFLIILGVMLKM